MQNKKILAVDPGYDRCGIAVFSYTTKAELLDSSCVTTNPKDPHGKRLHAIYTSIQKAIKTHTPDVLAIESLFFSLNKRTAMKVAEARGVILLAAEETRLEILEISPQEVKLSTTGLGNSDKQSVQKMVSTILKINLAGRIDDEIDAIAIGLAAIEILRVQNLTH